LVVTARPSLTCPNRIKQGDLHRRPRAVKKAICVCVCFLIAGCLAARTPALPQPDLSVSRLLSLYAARRATVHDFKGLLRVAVSSSRLGRQTFEATWRSENGQTDLRGFNLFGQTLFRLTASESLLSFFPSRGEAVRWRSGEPSGIEMPLGAIEIIATVNRAGVPALPEAAHFHLKQGDDITLTVQEIGGAVTVYWIERTHLNVIRAESFDAAGQWVSTVTFDDYRAIDAIDFPFRIEADNRDGKAVLTFREVRPLSP